MSHHPDTLNLQIARALEVEMPPIDLKKALVVAIESARKAGDLLRTDFHLVDGPRGAGSHADADREAELLIRERLLKAFPEIAFLGEETGEAGPRNATARWYVDPNDGTVSYLKGMRGSAVSIGLVVDGQPVLGVVFAFAAPDDRGDLIAWAEGQALTRNGLTVHRDPLPAELSAGHVVLVSQSADKASEANRKCVTPARFRSMPSIAYRLALVAVGDGEVAVSLNSPTGWDVAAGHALVRAVDGVLIGETGRPFDYHGGNGSTVLGGSAPVVDALRSRDLGRVFTDRIHHGSRFPTVRLTPGRNVSDAGVLSRAQGCILGQFAGDSLGSRVEFQSADALAERFPAGICTLADGGTWNLIAGQPTDDSEMALMLARSLVEQNGWNHDATLGAYLHWYNSSPFDMGRTTSSGLSGHPIQASKANGSLMRISPLGIWGWDLPPDQVAAAARADSALTHPNPVCQDACAVFVVALAYAIRTGNSPEATYQFALDWAVASAIHPEVLAALKNAATDTPDCDGGEKFLALVAFQNAFYRLLKTTSFEKGVEDTVMAGGDTDTNAAIAGALLGAVHGRDAVPIQWQRMVLSCRPLPAPGVAHPRPTEFWPVGALEIAENLLLAKPAVVL
jgi:ADP-ribosylglycohydrolase/fructose-1,6-bisphosphatase/inositol monophosphatase family enzyme